MTTCSMGVACTGVAHDGASSCRDFFRRIQELRLGPMLEVSDVRQQITTPTARCTKRSAGHSEQLKASLSPAVPARRWTMQATVRLQDMMHKRQGATDCCRSDTVLRPLRAQLVVFGDAWLEASCAARCCEQTAGK